MLYNGRIVCNKLLFALIVSDSFIMSMVSIDIVMFILLLYFSSLIEITTYCLYRVSQKSPPPNLTFEEIKIGN